MTFTSIAQRGAPCIAALLLAAGGMGSAAAQIAPATQPAPADGRLPVLAKVIEVKGDVQHAPIGTSDWSPCQAGEEYPELTKIRTGVRSAIKLQLGSEQPYSAMVIESVGLVSLSELHKTEQAKRVRIGVGYGQVRAGVAEGGLKSEFTVDSPVATLSKRGTWDFGLAYERGTDRFEIFLLDQGLVDALQKATGDHRTVLTGQAVTEAMRRWMDESEIRRNVPIADMLGQEEIDVAFNRIENDGLGVLGPGDGRAVLLNLSNAGSRQEFSDIVSEVLAAQAAINIGRNIGPAVRAEGFFGTGRGDQLLSFTIDQNSALAKSGAAKPGRYQFRRAALEGWMAGQKRK